MYFETIFLCARGLFLESPGGLTGLNENENLKKRGAGSSPLSNTFCFFGWKFYCINFKAFETPFANEDNSYTDPLNKLLGPSRNRSLLSKLKLVWNKINLSMSNICKSLQISSLCLSKLAIGNALCHCLAFVLSKVFIIWLWVIECYSSLVRSLSINMEMCTSYFVKLV